MATFIGPSSRVRQAVAVLFLILEPAVTTTLSIDLRRRCKRSLSTCSPLGLTLLSGESILRSMRHSLRQLRSCLTVVTLRGRLII